MFKQLAGASSARGPSSSVAAADEAAAESATKGEERDVELRSDRGMDGASNQAGVEAHRLLELLAPALAKAWEAFAGTAGAGGGVAVANIANRGSDALGKKLDNKLNPSAEDKRAARDDKQRKGRAQAKRNEVLEETAPAEARRETIDAQIAEARRRVNQAKTKEEREPRRTRSRS